jgi:hypothetical protein
MAKINLPKDVLKNPNIPKLPFPSSGGINPAEIKRIVDLNKVLETRAGFFIPPPPSVDVLGNTREDIIGNKRATFYIEKTTLTTHLFRTSIESDSLKIIGIWIWLIRDAGDTKLILSRASSAISENIIPEPDLRYQILSRSLTGTTEHCVSDFNLAWKTSKINEERTQFGGIKGFFVGKGAINNFLGISGADSNGIQIELWQRPDNSPTLLFSKVTNSKRTITLVGSTTLHVRPIDDGEGMSGSRPCPPFNS